MLNNFKQAFERKITLAPKEHQTQDEISALRDNMERVSFIINIRWTLVLVLVAYSVVGFIIHLSKNDFSTLVGYMTVPANALILVCVYNYFFMLNKDTLANITVANNIQLALDCVVVSILVYFSGGVESWFWVIYLLIIFEFVTITPRKNSVWWLSLTIIVVLGVMEWGNFFGWLPYITVPLSTSHGWKLPEYVSIRYLWQVAVIIGMTLISTQLISQFKRSLAQSRNVAIMDDLTGLYTRTYFKRTLEVETARALYDNRVLFIALIDIDDFAKINKYFGIPTGDALLLKVSEAITAAVNKFSKGEQSPNIVARISGEEFAVFLIENAHAHDGQPTEEDVLLLARTICRAIAEINHNGITVTSSIGVAGLPQDALDSEVLLERADEALVGAIQAGGNTVKSFSDCIDESAPFIDEVFDEPIENISRYLDE